MLKRKKDLFMLFLSFLFAKIKTKLCSMDYRELLIVFCILFYLFFIYKGIFSNISDFDGTSYDTSCFRYTARHWRSSYRLLILKKIYAIREKEGRLYIYSPDFWELLAEYRRLVNLEIAIKRSQNARYVRRTGQRQNT